MSYPEYGNIARSAAARYSLRPELVCALIENESSWNTYAVRYEPGFMSQYVAPILLKGTIKATEAYCRSMSWGLMQVMGQTARELGFKGDFLPSLCLPMNGIEYGCMKLQRCMKNHGQDETKALLEYNGGSDLMYPVRVVDRTVRY